MICSLTSILSGQFETVSNIDKAFEMQRYMKNNFHFLGIQAVERRTIQKPWIEGMNTYYSHDNRWELVQELWMMEEREFQYTAIDWIVSWKDSSLNPSYFEQLEKILATKSWWDTVDIIASNCVGKYKEMFPKEGSEFIEKCRNSSNIWLNRTALLHQLKYKEKTDLQLLHSLCNQFKINNDFFIQKAIGWSLREASKTFPNETLFIIEDLYLIGLAYKESMKYLVKIKYVPFL